MLRTYVKQCRNYVMAIRSREYEVQDGGKMVPLSADGGEKSGASNKGEKNTFMGKLKSIFGKKDASKSTTLPPPAPNAQYSTRRLSSVVAPVVLVNRRENHHPHPKAGWHDGRRPSRFKAGVWGHR